MFSQFDDPVLASRYMDHMNKVDEAISEKKFAVQAVYGSATTDGFLYTIGLTQLNVPELRISDFHYQLGASILSVVAGAVIDDYANKRESCQATADALVGHEGYVMDMDECGSGRFTFAAPSVFDTSKPLGMANMYYGKRVLFRDVVTEGWPCRRCVAREVSAACSCEFSCWWNKCDKLSDEQKNMTPDQWV